MRTCKVCGEDKPLADFYKVNKSKNFYHGKCKVCYCKKVAANKDPEKERAAALRRLYGLTTEDYDALHLIQKGKCAICGSTDPKGPRRANKHLFVDHDHTTGVVRGLLCHPCNTTLGFVGDNVSTLYAMIKYLGG